MLEWIMNNFSSNLEGGMKGRYLDSGIMILCDIGNSIGKY
jgi:hypothetical protein